MLTSNGVPFLIDEEDEPILHGRAWNAFAPSDKSSTLYVVTWDGSRNRNLYLHRLILNVGDGEEVGHRNGDGLDCRRSNLRIATHRLNLANQRPQQGRSSRFKGVSWNRAKGRWEAYIRVNGRQRKLGYFIDEVDAALAYDAAAIEAWGDFARPNLLGAH